MNPAALEERAIGQERVQNWVANKIKAKKTILLLDTCESGALVDGYTRSRTDAPPSEAAIGRLHEATGRPVLTAAAEGRPAFEGYEGHGVFTWALLDALRNGDRNGNGTIEPSELVAHVQDQVPVVQGSPRGDRTTIGNLRVSGPAAKISRSFDGCNSKSAVGQKFACEAQIDHVSKIADSCRAVAPQRICVAVSSASAARWTLRPADLTAVYEFTP